MANFLNLLRPENELELVKMLQDTGVIARSQQCKFCGCNMKILNRTRMYTRVVNAGTTSSSVIEGNSLCVKAHSSAIPI